MIRPAPIPIPLRPSVDALRSEQRRSLHRAITAIALAARERTSIANVVERHWPDDREVERIAKAASSPIDTADFPSAISTAVVLPTVTPSSAASKLFARALAIDLTGITSVKLAHPSTVPAPIFVGEGLPIPVAALDFGSTELGPTRKMAVITTLSAELDAATPETGSVIIGRLLDQSASRSLDGAVFGDDAADSTRPAGLLAGLTPLTASTSTTAAGAMAADLGALAAAIADAGHDASDMIIVANSAQAIRLRLLASPAFSNLVLGSIAIADNTVIGIAPSAIASAYSGAATVETSRAATLHHEDTNPLPIVAPGGAVASPVFSTFQMDLISLRLRCRCAWAALPGAVAHVVSTQW